MDGTLQPPPVESFFSSPLTSPESQPVVVDAPPAEASTRANSTPPPPRKKSRVYIELSPLPPSKREQYKPLAEVMERPVDEVIGEFQDGPYHYYFARDKGGIAYKFHSERFEKKYPKLVEAFQAARHSPNFKFKDFDPSATYIHPLSRIQPNQESKESSRQPSESKSSRQTSENKDYTPDPEFEEEEEDEDGDETESYAGATRRVTRQSKLPYSPRKSRSQRVYAESESERGSSARPATRSTRKRTVKVPINVDSEEFSSSEEYQDSTYVASKKSSAKPKRVNRPKFPPPSYGNVRPIDALDYDDYPSDPANEAFRRHRVSCEKCHLAPSHELLLTLKKKGKAKKRKRGSEGEFDYSDDEDRYTALGGWVRCMKCPVSCHWSCLAGTQRDEILKAARTKDKREWEAEGNDPDDLRRRKTLDVEETTEYICASCTKGGVCLGCMEDIAPAANTDQKSADEHGDVEMAEPTDDAAAPPDLSMARRLHFRCLTCKRLAHYEHLPVPPSLKTDAPLDKIATHYQYRTSWLCHDCASFQYPLDKIIAWRPYPPNAKEPSNTVPNYKDQLPREYLVKWTDRSYRRLSWVPHMWLVSTNPSKLKNFLAGGTKVELLKEVEEDEKVGTSDSPFEIGADDGSRSSSSKPTAAYGPLDALPDAERRIQPAWKTIDRVLDVLLWRKEEKKKPEPKAKGRNRVVEDSDVEMEAEEDGLPDELVSTFEQGEEPPEELTLGPADWEDATGEELSEDHIDSVVWVFTKWGDLGYDEASWDSPPRKGEKGYEAFVTAFKRYIAAREVLVPIPDKKYLQVFNKRPKDEFRRKHALKSPGGLELGQDPSLKLMDFQVDGFNWLCNNWWNHQPCILADDMGLGKTVQMSTFLGTIATKWNAFPALVVVPNSTITNWVREFERWAPNLRVVPFYGEKKARDIIKQFELFHPKAPKGHTNAKFHVLITTYEAAINPKDFGTIFKKQPRWEALVIDEGQRLKSDSSLLFKKLNELNSFHRVIMTGTPLNNNMRELFNLMNFLDPDEWSDLEGLEKQHESLNEEMIKQLHNRLRPYFLRRIKSEVLDLPAKNEVIIPVSMAPLQREVYRSILSHNLDLLKGLTQNKKGGFKGKLSNILMHLRKCLQHPYLHSEDIEPRGLSPQETHHKLIDASAKLRFLKLLLPKLKERGHRVLLFSQFVLALDVIEDFLAGEGFKFLRLDGNTKGPDRQKSMDEYNKPDSEYFIFLLTTRAGGVGINLFTADTVIIFDPDFNPHQDLQAIARAYRYGQKKTCLVFKLMVKDSAEERIMQIGKKKLVLDHLIVQKMDDDDDSPGENVESILTYGAQALFDADQAAKDITYSEHDIDQLIEKTEKEGDGSDAPKEGGAAFSFAKVWSAEKDQLEDVADEDQVDSWAQTLEAINVEREKERQHEIAVSGRGARRKAADVAKTKLTFGAMDTTTAADQVPRRARSNSDASAYNMSPRGSDDQDMSEGPSSEGEPDEDFKMDVDNGKKDGKVKRKRRSKLEIALANTNAIGAGHGMRLPSAMAVPKEFCGLCGSTHGMKECLMTDKSENLAEYRLMLINHADDEPWEERCAAVRAIDELLLERGQLNLIKGQPLHPIEKATNIPPTNKPKETTELVAAHYREKLARQQMPAPPVPAGAASSSSSSGPKPYQEQRMGNTVIRDFTAAGRAPAVQNLNAGASSSSTVNGASGRTGGGGGVVVNTPASGSGSGVGRPAMMMAARPGPGGSGMTAFKPSAAASGTSGVSAGVNGGSSGSAGEKCVVCASGAWHVLKQCPEVLKGPARVRQIMNMFQTDTSDPKKADALFSLKRIYKKQLKALEGAS